MCYQFRDAVFYKGANVAIEEEPLAFVVGLPTFMPTHTGNHRGYIAEWSVVDGRLLLIAMSGTRDDLTASGIAAVFPDATGPVLADWYTGPLTLLVGPADSIAFGGHQIDDLIVLDIECGRVQAERSARRGVQHDPIMFRPVNELFEEDSALVAKLEAAGFMMIGDVAHWDALELRALPGFELADVAKIKEELDVRGIVLGAKLLNWPPKLGSEKTVGRFIH